MAKALLEVKNIEISFNRDGVETTPVRSVSFKVGAGERVAVVGESGCGKSLTALALTHLPPVDRATVKGTITFNGEEIRRKEDFEKLRGRDIAYVFQDPGASLNPVMRVRDQMAECLRGVSREEQRRLTVDLLKRTGLPDPARAAAAYPCELSGGQQQRVMLAMALASAPKLLIADEPTTALDVTTQKQVLDLIDELAEATGMAVLLITHNLGLVAKHMRYVNVMYAGTIVESGGVTEVLTAPRHPYTHGLLNAVPMLDTPKGTELQDIPGTVPSPDNWPPGCAFAPRCTKALERCGTEAPEMRFGTGHGFSCFNPV
jgi:peptide/nickel transport system ATP-binding protein